MTDLERFFRRLVGNLAGTDPARLHRPLPLDDISSRILPYRANRRALQLDTSEDYELVLLRLCAGEGGSSAPSPRRLGPASPRRCRSTNPDLDVLHISRTCLTLRSEPLARALGSEPEPPYAPPFLPSPALWPEIVLPAARSATIWRPEIADMPGLEALRERPE